MNVKIFAAFLAAYGILFVCFGAVIQWYSPGIEIIPFNGDWFMCGLIFGLLPIGALVLLGVVCYEQSPGTVEKREVQNIRADAEQLHDGLVG